jgi:hypothetical protein
MFYIASWEANEWKIENCDIAKASVLVLIFMEGRFLLMNSYPAYPSVLYSRFLEG